MNDMIKGGEFLRNLKGGIKMSKKGFSKPGKFVLFVFLVVLLMGFSSPPAFAESKGEMEFNKKFSNGLNGGFTLSPDEFLKGHTNILIIIRFPWPWPEPDPPWWHFTVEVGYNAFKWDLAEVDETFHWWNVNPTLRLTFGKSKLKPFISAGPGVYFPKDGDAQFGVKAGLGFDFQLSDKFMFEIGADYHNIFLKEEDFIWGKSTDFFHAHGGFVIYL